MRGLRLERHGGDENVIESRGRSAVGLKEFGKVFGQAFVLDPIESCSSFDSFYEFYTM